jgi:hypothetical protein
VGDCWNRCCAQLPGKIPAGSGRRICRIKGALASSPRALDPRVVTCTNRVPGECEMLGQKVAQARL